MRQLFIIFLMMVILTGNVISANLYGNIYDLNLNKISDVIVEINSNPKQVFISKDGIYNFEVPFGRYELKANYYESNTLVSGASENISIENDGNFRVDLILFPNFEDEEQLMQRDIKVEGNLLQENSNIAYYIILASILLIVLLAIILYTNKHKRIWHEVPTMTGKLIEESNIENTDVQDNEEISKDLEGIIKVINDEGGRTTQKEIRKRIPLSEAKISLMIAELESKGIINKIKKGRGNIIILNK